MLRIKGGKEYLYRRRESSGWSGLSGNFLFTRAIYTDQASSPRINFAQVHADVLISCCVMRTKKQEKETKGLADDN